MKIINIHALDEVQNILDLFHSSAVLLRLGKREGFWCSGGTTPLTGFETLSGFANLWLKAFPLSGGFSPEFGLGSGLS
jgi:hypothetical protein